MKIQLLVFIVLITSLHSFSQNEQPPSTPKEDIFMVVEEMPEFPGGLEALKKFIADHIVYPEQAIQHKTEGRVHVSFIVNKNGSLSEATVVRGIGEGCDEEAIRVVNAMPLWKPGKQNGKAVLVKYVIPLTFSLPRK